MCSARPGAKPRCWPGDKSCATAGGNAPARGRSAHPGPQPAQVQYLTDDQLLAYFPNTPIGLIKTANGRKSLIFPHPGDEEKFIIRL
jgi:hypothetical protein